MEKESIYYCEKHSERARTVLKSLNGMSVEDAIDMLKWCSDCVVQHTTIDWQHEADIQKNKAALKTDTLEQPNDTMDLRDTTKSAVLECGAKETAPEETEPERSGEILNPNAGDGASVAPISREYDTNSFLKSYKENEAWLFDMSGGNHENVESIVADIAAVLDKHHIAHVTATTYRAVMYTLQRLHLARFKDFQC